MEEEINEMELMEKKLLIIEFNKGSQLDRSFGKERITEDNKKKFREELIKSTLYLMGLVDDDKLKNKDIREKIYNLTKIEGVSVGQAQKVINVSLKVYCFLKKKDLLKELDCPLDKITMKGNKTGDTMRSVDKKKYEDYQDKFEKDKEIRILKDMEYGRQRLNNFINPIKK